MLAVIISLAVVAAAIIALAVTVALFNLGMINSYHPMRRPQDGQTRVACVGDSITHGFMVGNWRRNNYPAILDGLLGDTFCVNSFAYTNRTALSSGDYPLTREKVYAQSLDFKPDIVLIMLGSNDSKKNNWNRDAFVADYNRMLDAYLAANPDVKIYLLTPTPLFNAGKKVRYGLRREVVEDEVIPSLRHIAEVRGCNLIDTYQPFTGKKHLFVDGVHPNARGARLLAETVCARLKDDLQTGGNI